MKLFTALPLDEIARYGALEGAEMNEAKKVLATEATAMVHGRETAERSAETARKTFEEGAAAATLPTITVSAGDLNAGIGLLSLMVEAGFASSNGEARRHIKGGAIRINDEQVSDEKLNVTSAMNNPDGAINLSMGKKKHVLIRS
jgi:tyrosyl-tRNA synthetase